MSVKDAKLFEASKLKLAALTKPETDCQDALIKLKLLVPYLIKNDVKFVDFMFAPLWINKFFGKKGDKTFVLYSDLLIELLLKDKTQHERTIQYFISIFYGDKNVALKDDNQLTENEQRLFPKIHYFIRSLASKFPKIRSTYLDLILNSFPFTTICTIHNFVCYFSNCSSMYLYQADEENRERILWRLIERLININSYLQDEKLNGLLMNRLMEVGLSSFFKFINKICLKGDRLIDLDKINTLNELKSICNQVALRNLFNSLSDIFLTQVVTMDNTTSVNLIILYLCSLNEELCFQFLDQLWNEAFEIPNPKPATVNYFCSFLCTAKFLSLDILIDYMLRISKKINFYLTSDISIDNDLENFDKTLKKHKYFYAMCNCFFNLVCIRSDEFAEKHVYQLGKLHIQKIITCSLNPLAVCPIEIVQKFADICKYYELALCNMILQRNRRIGLYDLLKKREIKLKLIYPFQDLNLKSYDKLSLVYRG